MKSMSDLAPDRHDKEFQLTDRFLRAVARWENAPHNQPGADKTWVEQLDTDWREHYRSAVRVR
jgi:hypothetical protein